MKHTRKIPVFHWILAVLQAALSAGFVVLAIRLEILPLRYLVGMIAALVLLLAFSLALLRRGESRWRNIVRGILGFLISVVVIAACAYGASVAWKVDQTMNSLGDNQVMIGVYVLKEDKAQELSDLQGYSFAALMMQDGSYTQSGIDILKDALGDDLDIDEKRELYDAVDALYQQDVQALIMEESFTTILEENETYQDFESRARLVYEIPVDQSSKKDTVATNTDTEAQPFNAAPFAVYISGSDTRSKILDTSRSDVNIIMVVNPLTKQILLVNTPRDYYIPNPAGNGARDKLTHCGVYGIQCSMQALSDFYGVDLNHYMQINFTGFEEMIDFLGGVEVYSDTDFTAQGIHFEKGYNYLNGEEALIFARDRHHQASGDNARGIHQMALIQAMIKKATSGTTMITKCGELLNKLQGMLATNIESENISALMKIQLNDMAEWNVKSYAVTGTGGSNVTYSMPGQYVYVMYPNETSVAEAKELIQAVVNGEILPKE